MATGMNLSHFEYRSFKKKTLMWSWSIRSKMSFPKLLIQF